MTSNEDLNKLFEAALGEKKAPSRFGTPEEMRKFSPVPMQSAPMPPSRFQADGGAVDAFQAAPANTVQQVPFQPYQHLPAQGMQAVPQQAPVSAFQAAPAPFVAEAPVQLDAHGIASLDTGLSAELGAILDAKVSREKKRRRRGLVFMALFFVGVSGGAAGWIVTNPERFEAMKKTIAEIKSVGDIQGMVAQYQKALDKIAVRGKQIDTATTTMGVDPASAADMEDQGFDKEMREMMGEDGGPTTASRNAKLAEKFKDVQESGSLMKKK